MLHIFLMYFTLCLFFLCSMSLVFNMGNYFQILLTLELFMLSTFFLINYYLNSNLAKASVSLLVFFVIMMVYEGVFGLSLMVSLSRNEGEDLYKMW